MLEGDLKGADGPASLFIDWFGARGGFGLVGGVGWHAPVRHGGWYAHPGAYYGAGLATGAVLGAAADTIHIHLAIRLGIARSDSQVYYRTLGRVGGLP